MEARLQAREQELESQRRELADQLDAVRQQLRAAQTDQDGLTKLLESKATALEEVHMLMLDRCIFV